MKLFIVLVAIFAAWFLYNNLQMSSTEYFNCPMCGQRCPYGGCCPRCGQCPFRDRQLQSE